MRAYSGEAHLSDSHPRNPLSGNGGRLRSQPRVDVSGIERQVAHLGGVLAACFVAALLGLAYWNLIRGPDLVARDENPRRIEEERRIRRGNILDRNGELLVQSDPGPKGTWERRYLVPNMAPVVGYSSIDHGTGGIEAGYDGQIRGDRAASTLEEFASQLLHLHSAGVSVTLTIELPLQRVAQDALGGRTGAVVVLDVRSGELLAMVSEPTFDPNSLEEDWPRLQASPLKPMLNRATQGLYPPGLVFETITLAAAIEEGLAQPTTVFTDELGVVLSVDPPISCPSDPPKTRFAVEEAYTWPCSVLFARLGLQLGGERLADYATQMGVGRPISLPIEVSSGQLLERGMWSELLAGRTAMGQGEVLVTPLEMALVVATVANDGLRPVPELVLSAGVRVPARSGEPRRVLSQEVAQQVQEIMAQAYQAGRREVALPALDLAGRASSAESGLPGAPPHAWFIGFAPVERPRYAVVVIVEHGDRGWEVAAPVATQVFRHLLQGQ